MPIVVLTGFVVLQLTISNVVYPILQGKLMSLSPLAIIVAMTFWSWVRGVADALIGVLKRCNRNWCLFDVDGRSGYIEIGDIRGALPKDYLP
jgi:hypothetical protein